MAKLTLLEIVQDILNDLDGEIVNSINDTVEALQVAQIVKTTYTNIIDGRHWPHLYELFQLEALGSTAKPNYLKIPDTIINIEWVKYNTRSSTDTKDKYTYITYMEPTEFVELVNARISSATSVQVVRDFSNVPLNIINNKAPQYYTSFDDQYLVFDSFDSGIENTLQQSKNSSYGRRNTIFTISDLFIPDLPVQSFSMLLAEAKSTAFLTLKQTPNQKSEQHSITQRRRMSQEAWRIKNGIKYPNYGRK